MFKGTFKFGDFLGSLGTVKKEQTAPARLPERMLLTFVLIVLAAGMLLEYGGKMAASDYPARAININKLSAAQLANFFGAPNLGDKKGAYDSVHSLLSSKAMRDESVAPSIEKRLVVRTSIQVASLYFTGCLIFLLAAVSIHLFLQRVAPRADQFLFPVVALLAGIGLILVFDVKDPYRDSFSYTGQAWGTALYGTLGFMLPFAPWFRKINLRRSAYICAGICIGLLVLMRVFGRGPGGVPLQLFGVEPVEFIKVLMALYMAGYLVDRTGAVGSTHTDLRKSDILPIAVMCLITAGLFMVVKDLGPVILIFGTAVLLLYLTTSRLVYPLTGAALLAGAAAAGSIVHLGFLHTRIVMWLSPWSNADPHGAQLADGFWGFATGGLAGSGLGLGLPAVMPRAGSDLIFASLGEELGLVGCMCVLALYCVLICRGLRIANRASTAIDRAVGAALTVLIGLQTCAITAGVSGLFPLTGVTLPFVAHGTSSLVTDYFMIGTLLAISGRRLPPELTDKATADWRKSADRVFVGFSVVLLVGVALVRLAPMQLLFDKELAARPIVNPDADHVSRPHQNPRLTSILADIPRGRVLDRNGQAIAYGQPGGSGRTFVGGAATALWLARTEAERGPDNPMGEDQELRGYDSGADVVDMYRNRFLPFQPRRQGHDASISMDYPLQAAAYNALLANRGSAGPSDGAAMAVVDVRSGQVLAAASIPSPAGASAASGLDRSLDGHYPPGSTFKIVTAAAALADGLDSYTVVCNHEVDNLIWKCDGQTYSRKKVTDEDGFPPHGLVNMTSAMSVSCNVYFSQLGLKVGAPDLARTATEDFGLRLMPSASEMCPDLADSGYGQGKDLVTPLEMAMVVQTVANDGQRVLPEFSLNAGTENARGIPSASAQAIGVMLLNVTQKGTARGVFDGLGVSVAGKTGSAQTKAEGAQTHSWFVGYAPADHPKIAFACVVEHGGSGRGAAGPACRDMVRAAVGLGRLR